MLTKIIKYLYKYRVSVVLMLLVMTILLLSNKHISKNTLLNDIVCIMYIILYTISFYYSIIFADIEKSNDSLYKLNNRILDDYNESLTKNLECLTDELITKYGLTCENIDDFFKYKDGTDKKIIDSIRKKIAVYIERKQKTY